VHDDGSRRLGGRDDFVRLKTAEALRCNFPVIPVLVDGGTMPKADQLPEDLKARTSRRPPSASRCRGW